MIELNQKARVIALVLIGVLLGMALLAGTSLFIPGSAIAQNEPNSGQPENPESTVIFTCTISELAVHTNRIHIRCNPGDGAISFFAASTDSTNIVRTNQFLTLANTAYALGKTINIWYESDQAQNPPGCFTSDCRKITALVIKP
jgi:hypothetical protein